MDILRFINSKDIREHLGNINYEFNSLEMEGIYTSCVSQETLDEAPFVYKPMEEIISNISETVMIDRVIKPIYNFKASERSKRV